MKSYFQKVLGAFQKKKALNATKKSPKLRAEKDYQNPYVNARRTWDEHVSELVDSRKIWQVIAIVCVFLATGSIGGLTYVGSQSKIIPYIVEIPTSNIPLALGEISAPASTNDKVVEAVLSQWIEDIRMVSPDMMVERAATRRVYSKILKNTSAFQKVQEIYTSDQRPEIRAATDLVDVQILDVLKQSRNTYQIDWMETVRGRKGDLKEGFKMKALINFVNVPPTSGTPQDILRLNPLGIFIDNFSWSRTN